MATARGITSGMGTAQLHQKMLSDPLYQQRQQQQREQEGIDNRAVSNMDRVIGSDIAQERQKFRGIEQVGFDLARRSDTLNFAKRTLDFQKEQAEVKAGQFDQSLDLRSRASAAEFAYKKSALDMQDLSGIEMTLGVASLGTNIYRSHESNKQHKEYMSVALQEAENMRQYNKILSNLSPSGIVPLRHVSPVKSVIY